MRLFIVFNYILLAKHSNWLSKISGIQFSSTSRVIPPFSMNLKRKCNVIYGSDPKSFFTLKSNGEKNECNCIKVSQYSSKFISKLTSNYNRPLKWHTVPFDRWKDATIRHGIALIPSKCRQQMICHRCVRPTFFPSTLIYF